MKVIYEFETNDDLALMEAIFLTGIVRDLVSITYTCVCGNTTKTVREEASLESANKDEKFLEQHSKCYEQHNKTISNFN